MTFLEKLPIFVLAEGGGNPLGSILFMLVPMLVIFYIMAIKPQQKKQREHDDMLKKLQVGDHIITSGGLHGKIASVKDKSYLVEIAKNVRVELTRSSVAVHVKDEDQKEETTG